jgi:glycosyltransferase involved in cell wall biosynthesis
MQSRSVTVVIPCHNEEGNLEALMKSVEQSFEVLGFTLPVLLINDGSTDASGEILTELQKVYSFLKVVTHETKKGVAEVWKTAIAHTKTDWICWSQADLESEPATDIPMLMEACKAGIDGIAGWRQKRGDGKVAASKIANTACQIAFNLKIHDMNWIKLVRRDILVNLPIEKITHRYILAILAAKGFNITEIPTPWHPRLSGTSKFGKGRLISSAVDFTRTCAWYYGERRMEKAKVYLNSLSSAMRIGLEAGRDAFEMELRTQL